MPPVMPRTMTEPIQFPGPVCGRDEEAIRAFARGELVPAAAAEAASHVASCPFCLEIAAFEDLRPLLAPLADLRVPEELLQGFVEEVSERATATGRSATGRRSARLGISRAAAVLLGALAISALLARGPDRPAAPGAVMARAVAPAPRVPATGTPLVAEPLDEAPSRATPVISVKTPVVQIMLAQGGATDVVMLVVDGDEAL